MLPLSPLKVNQFVPHCQFLPRAPVGNLQWEAEVQGPFMLIWEGFNWKLMKDGSNSLGCSMRFDSEGRRSMSQWRPGNKDGYLSCTHAGAETRGGGKGTRVPSERPEADTNIGLTFFFSFGLLSVSPTKQVGVFI